MNELLRCRVMMERYNCPGWHDYRAQPRELVDFLLEADAMEAQIAKETMPGRT